MAPRLFITGVTGYIGGDFLYAVTKKHPNWEVTALVRGQDKGAKVKEQFPNIHLVFGDNNSKELIEEEAAKADIVGHFAASSDDEPSALAISAGLKKTGGYWLHTSGTGILVRPDLSPESYGYDDGELYNDDEGLGQLTSLPDKAWHREIDKIVLATGNDKVKTAIICPPTIYGPGRGPINQVSMQAYESARVILKNKKGFIYGDGKNIWYQVHVQDLSNLYVSLAEAAVNGGSPATWNEEGYYLAENGSFTWGEILREITTYAHKQGYIPNDEVEKLDASAAKKGYPFTVATTSKGISYRAKKLLHWKPTQRSLLEDIPDVVDYEASKLGLKKA